MQYHIAYRMILLIGPKQQSLKELRVINSEMWAASDGFDLQSAL